MDVITLLSILGVLLITSPAMLLAVLGIASLLGRPLPETVISSITFWAINLALGLAVTILIVMASAGVWHVAVDLGDWVSIPQEHFHFHLKLVLDTLSMAMATLSLLLCGAVGAFTSRYLHREPGFGRFFVLYAIFALGMVVTSLAGTIEVLFFGWELVGLSSALLVAFFQERPSPSANGLRVWVVYRIADAAFLTAAVAMHHMTGAGDFEGLMGTGPWPGGYAALTPHQAFWVGLLLLIAAAGKSALIPFSGWLPRAMEGPTPSSAIFYGALSVHLGAFLLLRVGPVLELSTTLSVVVVSIGLLTAVYAAMTSRVQTDIKSALAFASLTQVGIIVAEIGLGLRYIALIHILGHACLRTLQLLRAPSLLHDYHTLENAIGSHLHHEPGFWERVLPPAMQPWFYRFALERGYLDSLLDEWLVRPFLRVLRCCDAMERKWTDWLSGSRSRESDDIESHAEVVEELRL
ncbi:MAG: oxidoreductase [Planctomycetes bacterium]|nr:oxidoreductase [Planctomycetota bacterium]